MYKSNFNLRNFKKGLRLVEEIARQNNPRGVDYMTGFCIASIKEMRKAGKITRRQQKALEDLAFETAEQTDKDITDDEEEATYNGAVLNFVDSIFNEAEIERGAALE